MITVTIDHGELERELYQFSLLDEDNLALMYYVIEKRLTKRHKFKVIKMYHRCDKRNNSIEFGQFIFDENIKKLAKEKLLSQIVVDK